MTRTRQLTKSAIAFAFVLAPLSAQANLSATVTLVNNYLFNGVSQTDKNPALQPNLNYDFGNGVYAGLWSSNVDYGSGIWLEFDGYVGYYTELDNGITVDTAINQYTYHGDDTASDLNFQEVYAKFSYQNSQLNFWYAWDYFGFGGGHYIIQAAHTFPINDQWNVFAAVDRSTSTNLDAWNWEGKRAFTHGQVMARTSFNGFDIGLGVHTTTLKERWGDTAILLFISKAFTF
ncbi:TorF family putative porin [Pseudoalteromonas xiamenensis]